MAKKILVLAGSKADLEDQGKPSKFVTRLDNAVSDRNSEFPDLSVDYRLDVCSADRTPLRLPHVLNAERYDGLIYHGGLALVLGAYLHGTLAALRAHETFRSDPDFPAEDSRYFRNDDFIPVIGVPATDTVSLGLDSFRTIIQNPPGAHPRPGVGLNRSDTAVKAMHRMIYPDERRSNIDIGYHDPVSHDIAYSKMKGLLGKFSSSSLTMRGGADEISGWACDLTGQHGSSTARDDVCIFLPNYDNPDSAMDTLRKADKEFGLVISCPVSRYMGPDWPRYFALLEQLNSTVSVGVGAYENAAALAAEIGASYENRGGLRAYRQERIDKNVLPPFIKDGRLVRGG